MERSLLFKYLFLLVVCIVTIIFAVYNTFGGDNDENVEDMFKADEEINESDFNFDELNFESEEKDEDEGMDEEYSEKNSETSEVDEEDLYNFEDEGIKTFGEEKVNKAKKVARDVVTLWLEENTDKKEWEDKVTKEFLKKIEDDLIVSSDGLERTIDKIDVYVVEVGDDEMILEVIPTFYFDVDGNKVERQQKLYYVTLRMDNKQPLVSELVEL